MGYPTDDDFREAHGEPRGPVERVAVAADARTLDAALRDAVAWGCETFPNADAKTCAAHLLSEARELAAEPTDATELADVAMLLAHTAHHAGVDLAAAVRDKLTVNRARKWGKPNAEGFIEHVR